MKGREDKSLIIKEQEVGKAPAVRSLDIGLALARANLSWLLLLPLLPVTFDLLVHYLQYSYPLSLRLLFATSMMHIFSQSVLLLAIVISAHGILNNQRPKVWKVFKKSVIAVPKVFFSYLTLLTVGAFAALFFFPFLLLIVLLIWAPIFSALEQFAIVKKEPAAELDIFDVEDFIALQKERSEHLFKYKSLFDLGFVRSLFFSRINLDLTFKLAILLWAAQIIPLGVLSVIFGGSLEFSTLALHAAISPFFQTLVGFIAVVALLLRLSPKVLIELELNNLRVEEPQKSRLERRPQVFIFCILISMASLWFVQKSIMDRTSMPEGLDTRLISAEAKEQQLFLKFSILDAKKQLRWFNESRLELELEKAEDAWVVEESEEQEEKASKESVMTFQVVDFSVFDSEHQPLDENAFSPAYQALEFELKFESDKKLPPFSRFVLKYRDPNGGARALLKSSYGTLE